MSENVESDVGESIGKRNTQRAKHSNNK